LIGEWNIPCVSLGIRIFILISIGEKTILDSHWFMKDEGAIDWREGFSTSIGQGEQSQGGVLEVYRGEKEVSCVLWKERGEGKYGKDISFYVGKGVVHEEKNMCKQEHGRKLCVAST
jgi:hypothetical protein